jgi:hypothetical protein
MKIDSKILKYRFKKRNPYPLLMQKCEKIEFCREDVLE